MSFARLAPIALAFLWGLNWPAVKIALDEIPPLMLRAGGQWTAAVILVVIAFALGRSFRMSNRDWVTIVLTGGLTIAGFNILVVFAQLVTTTSRAAILTFTMPIWTVLIARIVLGERLDRDRVIALALGATGIALLAIPLFDGAKSLPALLLPIGGGLCWAIGTVVLRARPIVGDRVAATAYQLALGGLVAAIGMVIAGEVMPAALSMPVVGAVAFHVIGATVVAYFLWFTLIERLPASTAGLTTFAIPLVGVLSAMALVGDQPTLLDWAGFAAILSAAGVVLFGAGRAAAR